MAQLGKGAGKYILDRAFDLGLSAGGPAGQVIETSEVRKHRSYLLQIRTATDVDWCTINTAVANLGAKEKLRNMWYDGYSRMYPSGTEWRITDGYI